MNDQTDKINWTDQTWNPATGCLHTCEYCYARVLYHRRGWSFKPTFHPERLSEPAKLKQPQRIFVCSVADLFGSWVPREQISAVLDTARKHPRHTFQFLTKNPTRLPEFNPWPDNAWVGATIDVRARLLPTLNALAQVNAAVRFISFEPLNEDMGIPKLSGSVEWIIIGAQTGKGAHQPDPDWVDQLVIAADTTRIPVLFKDNLQWPFRREDFPTVNHFQAPRQLALV